MSFLRRSRPRYHFPLIRIDDRLIHGQVILGWAEPLRVRSLVLVHDDIAHDEDLAAAISATVPSPLAFSILTIADAVSLINDSPPSHHLMVVVETPKTALKLWELGAALKSINIGGLHYSNGRVELLPYVFMSRVELDDISRLAQSGVEVRCQDLPNSPPVSWEKIMEKLDLA